MTDPRRRGLLALLGGVAAQPWLARSTAAQPATVAFADSLKKLAGASPVRAGRVKLEIPRLADNANSVPLRITVESPMTALDHVASITVLSEKNPRPLIATFHLGPRAGRADIAMRVRLASTQRLMAVARMADGSYWSGEAEVTVTDTTCLDEG